MIGRGIRGYGFGDIIRICKGISEGFMRIRVYVKLGSVRLWVNSKG